MVELIFLGTGGAVATADRDNTSYALDAGERFSLVDCSGSVMGKLRRAGLDPLRMGSLFITHVHPDHVFGLPSLIHGLFLEEGLIKLYGSTETVAFCAELLDLFRLREPRVKMRVELIPLAPGREATLEGSDRVEGFRVPHSPASLGFRFILGGGREIVCSGDTPPVDDVFDRARGADVLVHDCSAPDRFFEMIPVLRTMHTSALELGRRAQDAGVRCLIPCHFFGEVEYPWADIENEIRAHYTGRLILPRDLMRIDLTG
jgi:ribonuclease Z